MATIEWESGQGGDGHLLDAIRHVESKGNARAVSPAGAKGPYQFMPGTAREMGVSDPFDEAQARAGADRYFSKLKQQFGDERQALTAYNWGPANMEAYLRTGKGVKGQPMPLEAQQYADKVLRMRDAIIERGAPKSPLKRAGDAVLSAVSGTAQASAGPAIEWDDEKGMSPATIEWDHDAAEGAPGSNARRNAHGLAKNLAAGTLRGVKDFIDTGAEWAASGFDAIAGTREGERVRQMNEAGVGDYERQYGGSTPAKVGRFAGQVAATPAVLKAVSLPLKAAAGVGVAPKVLSPLAEAIASSGAARSVGLPTRIAGGAIAGGSTAGMLDPDSAGLGAGIGGMLPVALAGMGAAGRAVGALVSPFFAKGQERIAGDVLREFSSNPDAARSALRNVREVVPGSMPTTAAASGDIGIAGLQRAVQNANGGFASDLAARQSAQNAARLNAFEDMAGNKGKLTIAEQARDAVTGPMREQVLQRAGSLDAQPLLSGLEGLLSNPNNAGRLAQQALAGIREQIARNVGADGQINARALYAIRKDINDVLGGKLQGEAGNLRHASGQLIAVKGLLDDAIERGSQQAAGTGVAITQAGAKVGGAPDPTWRGYLGAYSEMSRPIEQMEILSDVLRRVQTGTADAQGNLLLSAAKLNQILKNEGGELARKLSPAQFQTLRNLAADLNAGQLAMNAGRATGSNTAQNIAQDRLLWGALGGIGASQPVKTTLGALLKIPYVRANQEIQGRLGAALLDPAEAARLMEEPTKVRLSTLLNPAALAVSRGAALLPANDR